MAGQGVARQAADVRRGPRQEAPVGEHAPYTRLWDRLRGFDY